MTDYVILVEELRLRQERVTEYNESGMCETFTRPDRDCAEAADAIEALAEENKKLREALEFYGWEDHWVINGYSISVCNEDRGRRARAALGNEQEYARKLLGGREEG